MKDPETRYEMQYGEYDSFAKNFAGRSDEGQHRVVFWDGALMGCGLQTVGQRLNEGVVGRLMKCLYEVWLHELIPMIKVNRIGNVLVSDLLRATHEDDQLLVCRAWYLSVRSDQRMDFPNEHEVLDWFLHSSGGKPRQ